MPAGDPGEAVNRGINLRSRLSKRAKLALLCLLLFAIGIARLRPNYDGSKQLPLHPEAIHLARSLAFHGQFANPFRLLDTGPSAYLSPGFPAFLALLIHMFGTGAKADYIFCFAAAAATAAELALLPALTSVMGLGSSLGIVACVIGLIPPILTFPEWEPAYAGLLIVLVTILWWLFLTNPEGSWILSVLLGVTAGTLLMTSATAFAVLAVWFGYFLWKFHGDTLRMRRFAVASLITIAMLSPWTVRNYIAFHRFIPFRTALGLALASSDNDCASVGVRESETTGCFGEHSPNHNLKEAAQARVLGEAAYNAAKLHDALQWIVAHPRRFGALTLGRISAFWFPHETNSLLGELTAPRGRRRERFIIYLTTILSIFGIASLRKANPAACIVLGSWLLLFPLIYYIALFEDRYRYPVLWVTFILAAHPLCLGARFFLAKLRESHPLQSAPEHHAASRSPAPVAAHTPMAR